MKVLITGGCGFLGSNLAAAFLSDGSEVIVVDALFRKGSSSNLFWLKEKAKKEQFHFIQADISKDDALGAVFRLYGPFDYVCHVAGQVAMTTSLKDPRGDLHTNILGTFNLLESVRAYSSDSLVAFSSTNKVYGDLEWVNTEETEKRYILPEFPNGFDESLPLDFSTPYGCSKGAADQYVRDWARVYGLNTVVFRHSSIYGGRQFASFEQGWIGWFCQQAIIQQKLNKDLKRINPFTIAGTGKQVRDVLHSDDLIKLYRQAYIHKNKVSGQIFNIGGGLTNSLSLIELFGLLENILDINKLSYSKVERRSSDQDCFIASIEKAKMLMDWQPDVCCKDGLERMIDWCKSSA